jgi:hypothetical protein
MVALPRFNVLLIRRKCYRDDDASKIFKEGKLESPPGLIVVSDDIIADVRPLKKSRAGEDGTHDRAIMRCGQADGWALAT